MKNVAIIGSGAVGKALSTGFLNIGYAVSIGTNNPAKLADFEPVSSGRVRTATPQEAALNANLIVLAVKGTAALEALQKIGADALAGKTVIDTTNPIAAAPPIDGVLQYFTTADKSLMELLQEAFPAAHFVKAFNIVGSAFMVNPDFGGVKPTMFIAGNNEAAKAVTTDILEQFGWEVSDMGKATAARAIEPLCILWCIPGFLRNEWSHAFKLLKK
jgi:8-hydroxy-5-deazaflavin:NADPH oxidoreductase